MIERSICTEQERTEATEQDKIELDGTELWLKSFRLRKKHMIASYYILSF